MRERFDRLDEQLAIVTGLWRTPAGERFAFQGRHYSVVDSPALPKPVRPQGPPVIVGGKGPTRTPRLAVRYADEFNVPFSSLADTKAQYERVAQACADAGRDPATLVLSAAQTVACGRTDAEARRRAGAIGEQPPVFGTPDQVVDQLGRFAQLGATRLFLQILDLSDLDHLDVIASDVARQLS